MTKASNIATTTQPLPIPDHQSRSSVVPGGITRAEGVDGAAGLVAYGRLDLAVLKYCANRIANITGFGGFLLFTLTKTPRACVGHVRARALMQSGDGVVPLCACKATKSSGAYRHARAGLMVGE